MVPRKEITPEQIARIKLRYEARVTPIHDIAREEGVTPSQIHELRRRFEWTTRTELGKRIFERSIEQEKEISAALAEVAQKPARDGKGRFVPKPAVAAPDAPTPDVRALALHVQKALDRELKAGQRRADDESAAGADARLRALASTARTLKTLQPIVEGQRPEDDGAEAPLDAAELRRELIRRIHRIRDERERRDE